MKFQMKFPSERKISFRIIRSSQKGEIVTRWWRFRRIAKFLHEIKLRVVDEVSTTRQILTIQWSWKSIMHFSKGHAQTHNRHTHTYTHMHKVHFTIFRNTIKEVVLETFQCPAVFTGTPLVFAFSLSCYLYIWIET